MWLSIAVSITTVCLNLRPMCHCHCTITPLYKTYFTSDRLISNSGSRVSFGMIYELFYIFNRVPSEGLDVDFFGNFLMDPTTRKWKTSY